MKSPDFPSLPFVPAKSYTKGRKKGQPSVVVIHTTEGHENHNSAEAGAAYDQVRTDGTSTTVFVDQDTIIQCVRLMDEAHAARQHGNDIGVHIEICGKAGQTTAQWNDEASRKTIDKVAEFCVMLRKKMPGVFPLVRLTPKQVRDGRHGFCGHVDITYAFPEDNGTHTDPGRYFPWVRLFERIQELERPPVKEVKVEWDEKVKKGDLGSTGSSTGRTFRQAVADLWNGSRAWWYANDDGSGDKFLVTPPGNKSRQVMHYKRLIHIEAMLTEVLAKLEDPKA